MDMYQKRDKRKNKPVVKNETKININWYPGHMAKTKRLITEKLDMIDLVYEVIDARIPYSSKIKDLDNIIKNKNKLMIMTKKDLCDIKETKKWIKYYEIKGYTVIDIDLINNFDMKKIIDKTNIAMIKENEKRKQKGLLKRKARILIIGIPNVGKSTLINRLVKKKVANIGNKPGVTKNLTWIRISEDLELLDTPGILWPKINEGNIGYNLASLTAIKEEILPLYDVAIYILETLEKYYPHILKERYKISNLSDDKIDVLDQIGRARGCLTKGNTVDYDKVISVIINDVKNGTIKNITFDHFDDIIGGK